MKIGTNTFQLNQHYDDGLKPCFASPGYCMLHIWTGQNSVLNEKKIPSEIPEKIEGYPVVCLREAFLSYSQEGTYGAVVKAPKIPKYVQDMKKSFYMSQISTPPVIPDSVVNLESTFGNCKQMLSFPSFGSRIKTMEYAFIGCTAAAGTVELPENVENIAGAFNGCSNLSEIPNISNLSRLNKATSAFSSCKTAVGGTNLPNTGLTSISYMFQQCTKMNTPPAVLHESITDISYAFMGCNNLSGTIDVRASINESNSSKYTNAFNAVSTEPGCELILNYTEQNESAIDNIIATKLITSNIKKGVLLSDEQPPTQPDADDKDEEVNGTAPIVPNYEYKNQIEVINGKGKQNVIIEGIVEPVNTLDVDVPVKLQFIIDENRNIHYTKNAKVISRSPAPINVFSSSVTVPVGAPNLVANNTYPDWDNLNIKETKNNIAISINNKNLCENGIQLGSIGSGFGGAKDLPLNLSVLYGKQWVNTDRLVFDYAMNFELALAQ
ncbi:MAG: hypothetical protein WAX04_09940 [Oscillospiraceae bacterium]